jgi:hypothetical protein
MTTRIPHLARFAAAAFLLAALGAAAPARAAEHHRLGVGIHYWRTVDELVDDGFGRFDEEGTSGVISYQYLPGGLFGLQLDGEYFADGFGGSTESTLSPQAYLVFSPNGWYAALGIGVLYSSDFENNVSDPFYAARIGLNVEVLPRFYLDLNANYRAKAWSELKNADTDTVTLGGVVRVGF